MMAGRFFLVLTGACQFGHGFLGGFTTNFIHSGKTTYVDDKTAAFLLAFLPVLLRKTGKNQPGAAPENLK